MSAPALELVDVSVRFGAVAALSGVALAVEAGTIAGLVGPNGAGKSTLIDAVSGLVPLDGGAIRMSGVDVGHLSPHRRARLGVGRTFQTLDLFEDLTATENVLVAAEAAGARRRGSEIPLREPDAQPRQLSHGGRKELALERGLAGEPRVLLLDEPAAGLDGDGRADLARRLRAVAARGTAVLVVDHDLELVLGLCDEVWVLDFGRVIAHGPPARVREDEAVAAAYLGDVGPTAATPRSVVSPGGETLLRARGLVAGYAGAPALRGVDVAVRAGEVVALLGANGAGKTTTLRALSGVLPVSAGTATAFGVPVDGRAHRLARLGLAHVPQDRAVLPGLTVLENLGLAAAGSRRSKRRRSVDAALDAFPALVPLLERRAGRLSGGEQQLLALARALARRPRLLLVDELSAGLAPRAARHALDVAVARAREGCGVLLAEQHPGLALQVADRAVVLARGLTVFEGGAAELARRPELLRAAYLGG